MPLIECVPNISEGKNQDVIDAIVTAIKNASDVSVLDVRSDADHNRTVITFVGERDACFNSAYACIKTAAKLIDMDNHKGEHPRIGATDVVPFVPVTGITIEECADLAVKLAEKVSNELNIPTYLYEAAATRPERENLANIRKGQYEGLKKDIESDPDRKPDFGPSNLPKAGATVIGAREFLIAYNIYLNTTDVSLAKQIALNIRHKDGGFRYVKAMGFETKPFVQVSMNLTNYKGTPMHLVVETVRNEAKRYGLMITETEVYGMIPNDALLDAAEYHLQLNGLWERNQIIEKKLEEIQSQIKDLTQLKLNAFVNELASDSPAPGGGSVAALDGALGAALGAMVCRLTIGKKEYESVQELMEKSLILFDKLSNDLVQAIEKDANAFNGVMAAFKMPKSTDEEIKARSTKIQNEYKIAAQVPLGTAKICRLVVDQLLKIGTKGNKNTLSDIAVGLQNAYSGLLSAIMNVEINLPSIKDKEFVKSTKEEIKALHEPIKASVDAEITEIRKLL
jgi:glutamate formiminotransferase / formiminotetrahydrofolate cyclodeaminase